MKKIMTEKMLDNYKYYLYEQEKSKATIQKYICDLRKFMQYVDNSEISKSMVIQYKEYLRCEKDYKTSSINSFLVAVNRFFEFMGWYEFKVKTFKLQKEVFMPENRELSKQEYKRLVKTAMDEGKCRIGMIIQTICSTSIRVSELSSITVASVKRGMATIYNKGKERQVLIPRDIQVRLLRYIRVQGIKYGYVFQTSNGKAVDRTWVWREMKKLCDKAGVNREKVFPHNLRHLFARTFYMIYKDIAKLADILGHSNIETTRIYLKEPYTEHRKQLEKLDLFVQY